MKIQKGAPKPNFYALDRVNIGECLVFKANLHRKHEPDDVFMRVRIISSYEPQDSWGCPKFLGKASVVNLRTGELAYVDKLRPCYPKDSEVRVEC